eukprot:s3641_g10.t1
MTSDLYDVVCDWLSRAGHLDIVVLQETHWGLGKQDATWTIPGWALVVTADPENRYSGVAVAISTRVVPASHITFCSWIPGRLLHVKCDGLRASIDIVGVCQWVKQEDKNASTDSKRLSLWTQLGRLVGKLPRRNLLVLLGDFNTPVAHLPGHVGRGLLVPEPLINLVVVVHENCIYRVKHGAYSGDFPLQVGVRQGCTLAPLLFSIFTCWLSDQLDAKLGFAWSHRHHTAFADDNLAQWIIRSAADLGHMCTHIRALFQVLQKAGMSINVLKSGLLLRLQGTVAKTWIRQHSRITREGVLVNVGTPAIPIEIPKSSVLTYLGIQLSYGSLEMQTCAFRMRAAQLVRQRLIKVLHTQGLRTRVRLQLHSACVRSSMIYGQHAVGITNATLRKMEAADARFVRAITCCPVHLTRVSNMQLYHRHKLKGISQLLVELLKGRVNKSLDVDAVADFSAQLESLRLLVREADAANAHGIQQVEVGKLIPIYADMTMAEMDDAGPTTAGAEMMEVLGLARQKMQQAGEIRDRREREDKKEWDHRSGRAPRKKAKAARARRPGTPWRSYSKDWARTDDLDPEVSLDMGTQNLLHALVRMALRHEEELSKLRIDTSVICYIDTVRSPLKVILLLSILQETSTRISAILQDEGKLQKALEWEWIQTGHQALEPNWIYFQWNPAEKRQEKSSLPPSKNSEVQGHLDYLAKHLAVPNVLTKFKASRPMSNTDRYASAVLPFFCSLSLRGDIASRCHGAIMALVNSSALKPVGMRIKPARGERQPAAAELEKAYLAVPYTQWQVRQPPWQRQMRGQPAEKPSEGTEEAAPAAATRLPPSRCGPFPYLLCP